MKNKKWIDHVRITPEGINDIISENWKTIHTEQPIIDLEYDFSNNRFTYLVGDESIEECGYSEFFERNTFRGNKCYWDKLPSNKVEKDRFRIASFMTLLNGHMLFLKAIKGRREPNHNEGNNLVEYLKDRLFYANESLKNKTVPDWLCDETLVKLGIEKYDTVFGGGSLKIEQNKIQELATI